MTTTIPDPFSDRRRWQWLALAIAVGWLIWLLAPILTPFVLSAGLAWLGEPLVNRIERSFTAAKSAIAQLDREALRQKRPVSRALAAELFRNDAA